MQIISHTKPARTLLQSAPKKQPRKSIPSWQPLATGLTREEIRAIILEQIG